MDNRLISAEMSDEDRVEMSLRPMLLDDFIGQKLVRENLKVFIESAIHRKDALDHVLFSGPPGLGKTTLAQIVAKELGVNFKATSGPIISKPGDLAAILTNLQPNDVLFIDEIHRINISVEEILYVAMEDFQLDLIIGEGSSARSLRIDLNPFTLVGATTRTGLISNPLRDRFGIPLRMNFYGLDDLSMIVMRSSKILNVKINEDASLEIARRSRGTPRIANRLLKRIRDFAIVAGKTTVSKFVAEESLNKLEVDVKGLDDMDRRYLGVIANFYNGGPVGVETLSSVLSEQKDTLEDVIEPYLLQVGLISRTPRGRMLTSLGWKFLGLEPDLRSIKSNEMSLFNAGEISKGDNEDGR